MVTRTNYYDALGRRYEVSQQAGSGNSTLGYVDDGSDVALAYNGSTSIGSLLGLGLDELFQLNFNGTLQSSVLKDPLGSVVGLSGSAKTITDLYQYEPYGASTHTSGTSLNNYQFAGQANDFNNLYFMRNRYYLPAIGRFISRDPAGLGGGTNMYAYAGDDPVNFSDPTGLEFVPIGGGSYGTYDGTFGDWGVMGGGVAVVGGSAGVMGLIGLGNVGFGAQAGWGPVAAVSFDLGDTWGTVGGFTGYSGLGGYFGLGTGVGAVGPGGLSLAQFYEGPQATPVAPPGSLTADQYSRELQWFDPFMTYGIGGGILAGTYAGSYFPPWGPLVGGIAGGAVGGYGSWKFLESAARRNKLPPTP